VALGRAAIPTAALEALVSRALEVMARVGVGVLVARRASGEMGMQDRAQSAATAARAAPPRVDRPARMEAALKRVRGPSGPLAPVDNKRARAAAVEAAMGVVARRLEVRGGTTAEGAAEAPRKQA
jgi:hypothetical protein